MARVIDKVKLTYYPYENLCGPDPCSKSATCCNLSKESHYAAMNIGALGDTVSISHKGRSTKVRILDRGGGVPPGFERWADISPAAWRDLGGGPPGVLEGATMSLGGQGMAQPSKRSDTRGQKPAGSVFADCLQAGRFEVRYDYATSRYVPNFLDAAGFMELAEFQKAYATCKTANPQGEQAYAALVASVPDIARGAAGDILSKLSPPGPFESIMDAVGAIATAIWFVLNPANWAKIGLYISGFFLLVLALVLAYLFSKR